MKSVKEHSLSIVLLLIMLGWLVLALWRGIDAADLLSNLFADTYGALIIVVATKWFTERGSKESK